MSTSIVVIAICMIILTFFTLAYLIAMLYFNHKRVEFMEWQQLYMINSDSKLEETIPNTFDNLLKVAKEASKGFSLMKASEED